MRTRNIEVQRRSSQKYVETHRAAGLCVRCPLPALPGKTLCPDCAETQRVYAKGRRAAYTARQKEVRALRRAAAVCLDCGAVAIVGQRKCELHAAKDRGYRGKQYAADRAAKKVHAECIYCHAPPVEGRSMCQRHVEMNRRNHAAYNERRRAGVPKREYSRRGLFVGPIQQAPAIVALHDAVPPAPRPGAPLCVCGRQAMRGGSQCFPCARMARGAA